MKELNIDGLKNRLELYNQTHLLKFWDSLNNDQKVEFFEEFQNIQFQNIEKIYKDAMHDLRQSKKLLDPYLEPVFANDLGSVKNCGKKLVQEYFDIGLKAINNKKVAVILMAGGVGSRLGVNYPKGMYDVGLLSNKSLYQIQAERILRLNHMAHDINAENIGDHFLPGYITWCIMTSDKTYDYTKEFFESHNYFGLDHSSIKFFKQYSIPCLDMDGKIILEAGNKISMSPEGNGGIYRALNSSGTLNELIEEGIEYLHIYGVDNILVKVADPVFLGFCIKKNSECGVKVIEKVDPNEAVGVVCKVEGNYQVVEYSEISSVTANKRSPEDDDQLLFNCGNIANHFFSIEFLKKACNDHENLRYHVAKKKISYASDPDGRTIKPDKPNGIKMEKFIFDVFPLAKRMAVWLVLREDEFSPLKNSDTEPDSNPYTCKRDLYASHRKYVEKAGGTFLKPSSSSSINGLSHHVAQNNAHVNGKDELNSGTNGLLNSNNSNGGDSGYNSCFDKNKCLVNALPDLEACEISPLISYSGENLEEYVKGKVFTLPFLLNHEVESPPSILTNVGNKEDGSKQTRQLQAPISPTF